MSPAIPPLAVGCTDGGESFSTKIISASLSFSLSDADTCFGAVAWPLDLLLRALATILFLSERGGGVHDRAIVRFGVFNLRAFLDVETELGDKQWDRKGRVRQ